MVRKRKPTNGMVSSYIYLRYLGSPPAYLCPSLAVFCDSFFSRLFLQYSVLLTISQVWLQGGCAPQTGRLCPRVASSVIDNSATTQFAIFQVKKKT
jgi:hypothetical protein